MTFTPTYEREVVALRILPRWFGGHRVEIRRRLVKVCLFSPMASAEEEVGTGPWRKMRAKDYADVARFL